jgi:hypothetical protein
MKIVSPLLACLAAALTFAVCAYLYYDIGVSAVQIKESRDTIATISARDTFAKAAAQFLAETTAERNAVQFFITPADGTAQSIELVENAAKLAGVQASVGAATIAPLGTYHERLTVTVSAEGTFAGQARFATVLESLPRGASLTDVTLSATQKGWFGTYIVSFIKQK